MESVGESDYDAAMSEYESIKNQIDKECRLRNVCFYSLAAIGVFVFACVTLAWVYP
jgi:hypothetical protein